MNTLTVAGLEISLGIKRLKNGFPEINIDDFSEKIFSQLKGRTVINTGFKNKVIEITQVEQCYSFSQHTNDHVLIFN